MNWLRVLNKKEFWDTIIASVDGLGLTVEQDEVEVPSLTSRMVGNKLQYYLLLRPSDYEAIGGNTFAHLCETVELGLPGTMNDGSMLRMNPVDRADMIKTRLRSMIHTAENKGRGVVIVHNLHLEWKSPPGRNDTTMFPNKIFLSDVEISFNPKETRFSAGSITLFWNSRSVAYPEQMTLGNVRIHTNHHNRVNHEDKSMTISMVWPKLGVSGERRTASTWFLNGYKIGVRYPSYKGFTDLPEMMKDFSPYDVCQLDRDNLDLTTFIYFLNEEVEKLRKS